ncbi:MAG: diguanylate cyclase [Proteobacteria bacterium]|nr:diguanylate cyclase [Pseudomonadota bacterium]
MSSKRPDTISSMMRRRQADSTAAQPPASDYDRLMAEYRQLQELLAQQKKLIGSLEHDAMSDSLTGLANRRTFEKELERSLATARRYGRRHAVLLIDINDFKSINDNLGHLTGDAVLTHIARLLRQNIRPTDIAARLGGDEFAVILNELRAVENADHRAQEISQTISHTPCIGEKSTVHVSISIGCSVFGADDEISEILEKADKSMYANKQTSKM